MTDHRPGPALPLGDDPAERARREERHAVLADLLAAYADGELPAETVSQIDAHLVGCDRCRRDLSAQQAVRRRLGAEPIAAASPALRERIGLAIEAAEPRVSGVGRGASSPPIPTPDTRRPTPRVAIAVVAVALTIAAAAFTFVSREPGRVVGPAVATLQAPAPSVPLLRDVLSDYRRVVAGDLPGRARDLDAVRAAVGFPVEPMQSRGLRLLAAWTTTLAGEPAAVLAYRWDDRILLQYLVSEERFFRHPAVRAGVTGGRVLAGGESAQAVAAWPAREAGAVLVGDLSVARLAGIAAEELLVRRRGRGAE